jgi:hypothetical protein
MAIESGKDLIAIGSNEHIDKTENITISNDEFATYATRVFSLMDKDKDRVLSGEEVHNGVRQQPASLDAKARETGRLIEKHFGILTEMSTDQLWRDGITEEGMRKGIQVANGQRPSAFGLVESRRHVKLFGETAGFLTLAGASLGLAYAIKGCFTAAVIAGTLGGSAVAVGAGFLAAGLAHHFQYQDWKRNGKRSLDSFLNDMKGTEDIRRGLWKDHDL